jgi:hypothetical protein
MHRIIILKKEEDNVSASGGYRLPIYAQCYVCGLLFHRERSIEYG